MSGSTLSSPARPEAQPVAGAAMLAEIAEQPQRLQQLLGDPKGELDAARRRIRAFSPSSVLLAGRGTSGHAALYAKYLVETRMGLPAGSVAPSSLTVYRARPHLAGVLWVVASQSGGSPDLVEATNVARACGALTVAVTNAPESALAQAAELRVDIGAGPERAVAATKSYTAELLALYLLLVGGDARAVPDAAAATLAHTEQVKEAAGRYRFTQRLIVTGRGYALATAHEAALKLMETSYISAQAFSAAELLHGPVAMVGPHLPVIAVTTPGAATEAMSPVLERLATARADVLSIGGPHGIPVITDGMAEELHPLLSILPLQRLAWQLAVDRGEDPDRPRGLSKVTETR